MSLKVRIWLCMVLMLFLSACATPTESEPRPTSVPQKLLTPYIHPTQTETPMPVVETQPVPLPSPTPTPRLHIVKAGEDLGGIAYLYQVSLQSLMELNPDVDPRFLSVGTQLVIPPAVAESSEENLLPAPGGVTLGNVTCAGLWCFVEAASGDQPVENVAAVVRVRLAGEEEVRSGVAVSPLDRLPANSTLPLMVRFSFPLSGSFQVSAELDSALPVADGEQRYVDVDVRDVEADISPQGGSAEAKGVIVNQDEKNAQSIRLVLVARNEEGQVVGVRIWEDEAGLEAGQRMTFLQRVYSVGGEIKNVGVFVEAKP